MVYNGYYKVMSNIPKMGQLPTPVRCGRFITQNGSKHGRKNGNVTVQNGYDGM
jgi:hypothetical protein